ncbi:MAG: hypothetical protein RLY58_1608 [Pseudomonadota bacterium]|jgi:hypothetical protein
MQILIIGGYGTFGGRLATLLQDEPQLTLQIAGRHLAKAQAFCQQHIGAAAQLIPTQFDRQGDLTHQLGQLMPHVVIDATGPFQTYGEQPYRLIQACVSMGIHYMDLADGSVFVEGVSQFDEAAKQQGVFILSGVSSFPVLTAAVVRHLAQDMTTVTHIKGGIAPSPYAGVGLNVIRAIAEYAGQPLQLHRDGQAATAYALTESQRYTIAPPAHIPLRCIHFSLVDVPDLRVIPPEWPQLSAIWMGAGPVPEVLHRMLNALAWLVRWRLIPSLAPAARLFYWAINLLVWGEHRGGMFVEVQGIDQHGEACTRSWHLVAEGDDGPLIPSMAIEAIIRRMLAGQSPAHGARPAIHALELADYNSVLHRRNIYTGVRRDRKHSQHLALYQRLLGEAWPQLPDAIRQAHLIKTQKTLSGQATITRGSNRLARWVANLFSFPQAGQNVPVSVTFQVDQNGHEHWQRSFGGKPMTSIQFEGQDQQQWLLMERFGVFVFGMALVIKHHQLHLIIREWSCFGLRLPLAWAPHGDAYEFEKDGIFHFHVEIMHALLGLIVCYDGHLSEVSDTPC